MKVRAQLVNLLSATAFVITISSCHQEIKDPSGSKVERESSVTRLGGVAPENIGVSVNTDESERSDRLTGGKITQASLTPGDRRIWLTVNIPAFRLTFWQNGNEIKTYRIGIGRRSFPLPIGERLASEIVWNPEWIPPDASWVEESSDVWIGERIEADDPRNPLGKIKILLGEGILIHATSNPSDLGRLVSHGCVRMMTEDLIQLAEMIITARSLPVPLNEIDEANATFERLAVRLNPPVWVDINYDTQVIENGVLHLYPDVYNLNANTIERLQNELIGAGVDASMIDEQTLTSLFERLDKKTEFQMSIAEIKAGRALTSGR